jgi:serine/threonine protein kinase
MNATISSVYAESKSVDSVVEEELRKRGYEVLTHLGEGHTRDAYLVLFNSPDGSFQDRRVAKIQKREIDETSITTRINQSKGDSQIRELVLARKFRSKHFTRIYDVVSTEQGLVIIEDYDDKSISLEALIQRAGPIINPQRFSSIFSQVVTGLQELYDAGFLHRDIKPSNLLVGEGNESVKITDLQNTGASTGRSKLLPTRGATAYTDPRILNDLMEGRESFVGLSSERYALGATIYYALTGKPPFKRSLTVGESERIIEIDGEEIGVVLLENDVQIPLVNLEDNYSELVKKIRDVPKIYRRLLKKCWFNHVYFAHDGYSDIQEEIDNIKKERFHPWKEVKPAVSLAIVLGGLAFALIAGTGAVLKSEKYFHTQEPELIELLASKTFFGSGYPSLIEPSNVAKADYLAPRFREVKKRFAIPNEECKKIVREGRTSAHVRGLRDFRVVSAFIRSICLEDEVSLQAEYGDSRYGITLVPKVKLDALLESTLSGMRENEPHYAQKIGFGVAELKAHIQACMIELPCSLDELFAGYFSSPNTIRSAKEVSGTNSYLNQDGSLGYASLLSPSVRRLTERAIALHAITDYDGKLHLELVNTDGSLMQEIKEMEEK